MEYREDFLYVRIPRTASTSFSELLHIHPSHRTAYEWKRLLGDKFDKMFKFTIVRNPYERFISLCWFFQLKPEEDFKGNSNFRPQVDYIFHNGKNLLDYIGRYEDLENSWKYICDKINMPYIPMVHTIPNYGPLRPEYKEIKDTVNKFYKQDFELLNYPIDLS